MTRSLVFAALVAGSGCVFAQGYFDFSQIPGIDSEPKVQIDLGGSILDFIQTAAREADPNSEAVIGGIEGIRVRVYEIGDNEDEVLAFIDEVTNTLERDDWERMVYVQDDDTKVRVYVKFAAQVMEGMTIMVAGREHAGRGNERENEAVFINVAGSIDPAVLGQIANNFGVGDIMSEVTGEIATELNETRRGAASDTQ